MSFEWKEFGMSLDIPTDGLEVQLYLPFDHLPPFLVTVYMLVDQPRHLGIIEGTT